MQLHKFFIVVLVVSDSFATLRTVAHQAPLSMRFPRQEYWSGVPFPSPGDLPDPGMEAMSPQSPALQADSLPLKFLSNMVNMNSFTENFFIPNRSIMLSF